jgi:hypothetical protein
MKMSESEGVTVEESETIEIIPDPNATTSSNSVTYTTGQTIHLGEMNLFGGTVGTTTTSLPFTTFAPLQTQATYTYSYFFDARRQVPASCRCGESMTLAEDDHIYIKGAWYCSQKCWSEKLVADLAAGVE